MENKREILEALLPALQKTRVGRNLQDIVLDENEKWVTLLFRDGEKLIYVAYDSGIAMILDIADEMLIH